jgi:flagellar motor switch protein FliN/FliY
MDEEKNGGGSGGLDQDDIDNLLSQVDGEEIIEELDAGDEPQGTVYGGELTDEKVIQQADIDTLLERSKKGADPQKEKKAFAVELGASGKDNLGLLLDVGLNVRIELGRTKLPVEEILRLHEGAVVELDKLAGDPLDILINGRLVARGEVLVLNDNFCVRITDILNLDERLRATKNNK